MANMPSSLIVSTRVPLLAFLLLLLAGSLHCVRPREQAAYYPSYQPSYYPQYNRYQKQTRNSDLDPPSPVAGQRQAGPVLNAPCPTSCTCHALVVDCSYRNLIAVPLRLPTNAERVNLVGNKITTLKSEDFRGLRELKVLQLMNNDIEDIFEGAFADLVKLKKLRLSRNMLKQLRDNLFQHNAQLQRLDLKDNQLTCIHKNTFTGLTQLRQLQLENNKLVWIAKEVFRGMTDLSVLRLGGNPLKCNCHLRWLQIHLNQQPHLAQDAECGAPSHLQGRPVAQLLLNEFQCTVEERNLVMGECGTQRCSKSCSCSTDGNADCKNRLLTTVPDDLPETIQEIDLQSNKIEVLPPRAFSKYPNVRKLFLNQNKIQRLPVDAFEGLGKLTSLYLNYNQLRALPRHVFKTLSNLKFLYIHGNKISCLPQGAFDGLQQLYLLHLSENQITSVQNGTFSNLPHLRYLYMVSNPLICDCNLAWMVDFLAKREGAAGSAESAFASCAAPERMKGSQIRRILPYMFQCLGTEGTETAHAGQCDLHHRCPTQCECTDNKVDCASRQLHTLPTDIPLGTVELILKDNLIQEIQEDSIFKKLTALRILDLSENRISRIDSATFKYNNKLHDLDLSGNLLTQISDDLFKSLTSLKVLLLRRNKIRCLNNDTFSTNIGLNVLMLNDNSIKCVMRGTLEKLTNLHTLSLHNNPLHCNCHVRWLSPWLRTHIQLVNRYPPPTCATPSLLTQTPLFTLEESHFLCETLSPASAATLGSPCQSAGGSVGLAPCCSKDSMSCDSRAQCPAQCTCEGTRVMCNDKNLKFVPADIPLDTEELFLERNSITDINSATFAGLTKLRILSLSYNGISELPAGTFSNLTSLNTIILSYNKLQCINERAFKGAVNLKALILQSNDISTIPYGTFSDLKKLNNIALGHNPFYCDCNIKWLNEFFHAHFLDNGISLCAGPQRMENRPIYHSRPSDFTCTNEESTEETYWGVRTKCEACLREPCKNGGRCHLLGESRHRYRCECQHPYHGLHCEQQINACFGEPCQNNGTCRVVDNFGKYECICAEGFTGTQCTQNVNDCVNHRCANGGRCVDGVRGYTCECAPGFRGVYCEQSFTYCTDMNPCLNGAQCRAVLNGYQCICVEGWMGKNCEENVDDCKYNSCMNGATCLDLNNNYSCICRPGYQGHYCQHFAWNPPEPLMSSDSVCSFHNCQNGARCIASGVNYHCECLMGFGGKYCEKMLHVHFNTENSYARFVPKHRALFKPVGNVTLVFSTTQSEGIILFYDLQSTNTTATPSGGIDPRTNHNVTLPENEPASTGQFLGLDIFHGHLRLAYNVGKAPGVEGFSVVRVNTGEPFKVELEIRGENISLYLNGRFHAGVRAPFEPEQRYLDLQAPLYLGGGPLSLTRMAKASWRVRSTQGFSGCIVAAYVNSRPIDFAAAEQIHRVNVMPGCPERLIEQTRSPVKPPNPCKNESACLHEGKCQPDPTAPLQYKCLCPEGFTGMRCENAPSCTGHMRHMNLRDPVTNCLSKRKVKLIQCAGQCKTNPSATSPLLEDTFENENDNSGSSKFRFYRSVRNGGTALPSKCCRPVHHKTRRLRFVCYNGSVYEKRIQLPRQCGCTECSVPAAPGLL